MNRAAMQQEYLKRKKMNTYGERRKEGRTIHTKASKTAIIIGALGLIFNIMAVALPNWRSSWVGLIGYGTRRNWGLLYVQGRKTTFHHTMYDQSCKWYGHLMLGNSCISPICRWHLLKCNIYFELCMYSYGAAFAVILGLIMQMLCVYWTVSLSTRTLRWAANWWPVAAFLNLGGAVFWMVMTEGLFEQLDEESWYPIPPPGLSFMLSCTSSVGMLVNAYLGYTLHYMWPEVDLDDPNQFDSEVEEDDEDEVDDEKQYAQQDAGDMYGNTPAYEYGGMAATPDYGNPVPNEPMPPLRDPEPEEPQGRLWYYKDDGGNEQGPFPSKNILSWLEQGMLNGDLQIRAQEDSEYFTLGDGSKIVD